MRISATKKPKCAHFISIAYFTSAHGKVYQLALMKESFHGGVHALTGLMFAPSVIMFS